jgi:hypothetical protein
VADEWFRGPDWRAETQELFAARLARARSQRPQYLRIKGHNLAFADDGAVRQAGRELLIRVLAEHADDELQVAMTCLDLANSLARDRRWDEAADYYTRVVTSRFGGFTDQAALAFAEAIIEAGWIDRYDEALRLLERSAGWQSPFPIERFHWNLAGARIARAQGRAQDAAKLAAQALAEADIKTPPFQRHPDIGLVAASTDTLDELRGMTTR